MARFSGLSALMLNCSLVHEASQSHTRRLLARVGGVMRTEGVAVELIHLLEHRMAEVSRNDERCEDKPVDKMRHQDGGSVAPEQLNSASLVKARLDFR